MNKYLKYKINLVILLLCLLHSCGQETFAPKQNKDADIPPLQVKNNTFQCSSFTLIKPPVDFLFLWDNSSSTTFINSQTKASLNNLINNVSERFDYNILMAPLIASLFLAFDSPTSTATGSWGLLVGQRL